MTLCVFRRAVLKRQLLQLVVKHWGKSCVQRVVWTRCRAALNTYLSTANVGG